MTCLFVDQLTVIDASFLNHDAGVVGESWIVDVVLSGELNEQGMIFDFGHVKKQIKQSIDAHFDHKLLVPEEHADISRDGNNITVRWACEHGVVVYEGPESAVTCLPGNTLTTDCLTDAIEAKLADLLPDNVTSARIQLRHEDITGAWYRYSHGLKKHDGACQRIAHGHRSQLHIIVGEERDGSLEAKWARKWQDIYIGTRADLEATESIDGIDHYRFAYTAIDGDFSLVVPTSKCYLIDSDSTVENIAMHLRQQCEQTTSSSVTVKAFEGVQKGALSTS